MRRCTPSRRLLAGARAVLSAGDREEEAYHLFVQGTLAFDQRDWQTALDWFEQSLAIREQTKNERLIAWSLTNVGLALHALQRHGEAIAAYERAIALFETIQDPVHLAVARMNLGNVYLTTDQFNRAIALYSLAEPVFHQTQDRLRLAMLGNNQGMAYQKVQQWDKAQQAYAFSIEQRQQLENIKSLMNTLDNLGEVHIAQGLDDKAKATFHEGLTWLAHIQSGPGYDHLVSMVKGHLQQVTEPGA